MFGDGPKPQPKPSPEEIKRRHAERIKQYLDSEPVQEEEDSEKPTFTVLSRSASDMGRAPGPWQIELETEDLVVARRLARAITKQGWVDVSIVTD
jgi:hypothetical protein